MVSLKFDVDQSEKAYRVTKTIDRIKWHPRMSKLSGKGQIYKSLCFKES